MDVDDDEGTQKPHRKNDYGIEVDFENLDDDEREVCQAVSNYVPMKTSLYLRTAPRRREQKWMHL